MHTRRRDLLVPISFGRRALWFRCSRSAGDRPTRMSGKPQHSEGQALALRGRGARFSPKKPSRYRSAGACPPRSFDDQGYSPFRSLHGEGNPLACTCGIRGPKPYDAGGPSAAAAPGGTPPYCIETRRSLLPNASKYETPSVNQCVRIVVPFPTPMLWFAC